VPARQGSTSMKKDKTRGREKEMIYFSLVIGSSEK
jgi:hypothetical protein